MHCALPCLHCQRAEYPGRGRVKASGERRPHEFVPLVMSEIQGAFGKMGSMGRSAQRKGSTGISQQCILEDIIYYWMLAEAYVQHPALQADMRCVSCLLNA